MDPADPLNAALRDVKLLRIFVEFAPVPMAMVDRDLVYIAHSRKWREASPLQNVDTLVGRNHHEAFPNLPAWWTDVYARCLKGHIAGGERDSYTPPEGPTVYFRWGCQPWRHADGSIGGLLIFGEIITQQVLTENRERESTTLLRTFFDTAPFMMGVVELLPDDIRYVDANRATAQFFNVPSPEHLAGRLSSEFAVSPQSLHRWLERLRQARQEGTVHFDFQRPSPAGTRILSVVVTSTPTLDGQYPRFCYVVRDITEERAAAAALARSEELLKFALEATDAGVWDFDLVARTIRPSDRAAAMLGYLPGEMDESQAYADSLVHPEDLPRVHQALAEHIHGRAPAFNVVIRMRHKAGHYIWMNSRGKIVSRDADGNPLRIVGTGQDITQLRQQEENLRRATQALAESEERLALALDATNEGVWDWDLESGKIYASPRAAHQIGMSPAQLGDTLDFWVQQMHPDEVQQNLAILHDYLEGKTPLLAAEVRFRHQSGGYVWTELRGKIVRRDPAGRPLRMVGTHLDITHRKSQEEELRRAKEAAQAASQAKSDFLANVSHEIRTPLSAILASAEILEESDLSQEKRTHFLEVVRRSGKHLMTLINSILDFSKLEAGKTEVERLDCKLHQLADEVMMLIRQRATAKGIHLTANCPHTLRLFTDTTRLRQILTNLLDNAIKFTPRGGSVSLHAVALEDPPRIRIDIRDTGVGISPQQQSRLFQPFAQADSSTTRRFGGTGLGLAISRRLANILGGDIQLASALGKGSCFTLWLPRDMPREAPVPMDTPPRPRPPLKARILMVEDGEDLQILISHVLEKAGATLDWAMDGAQGVARARAAQQAGRDYDLILMDIQMPGMDGNTATAELRKMGINAPIIALTAAGMEKNRQQALAAGCDDFLVKPINTDRLLEVIYTWVNRNPLSPDI